MEARIFGNSKSAAKAEQKRKHGDYMTNFTVAPTLVNNITVLYTGKCPNFSMKAKMLCKISKARRVLETRECLSM